MARYRVLPNGSGWVVERGNGAVVSNHYKKTRAVEQADREGQPGDQIEIRRADGTVQNVKTV